ncbi:MAG: ATP synthase F1 subunit delta [Bacteroidetes bacterium]|nr:ATP synthase F1 subunit delta [Bacteroidota bacterium]
MKETRAARRYAGALLELCGEMKRVDEVASDMRLIHDSISSSHELYIFFKSPIINRFRKRDVIKAVFATRVNQLTLNFLFLLIDKGREKLVDSIAVEFAVLLDQLQGIVNAELRAPFKLDEKAMSQLKETLETLVRKSVRVSFSSDRALLGGFLVQIGDTVYDGSVRRQLEILKQQLSDEATLRN